MYFDSTCNNVQSNTYLKLQTCYSIATAVSIIALAVRIRIFRAQILSRRYEFEWAKDEAQTQQASELNIRRKRLISTDRSIQLIYVSILVGLFECLPLGLLQVL